jgi:Uma2 family endonuclease
MSLPETVQFHKLTVREFHALDGILDPHVRHELLDGQILVMTPPGSPHTRVLDRLHEQFTRQKRPGLHLWSGGLRLNEVSELWPDLTLLEQEPPDSPDNPSASEARLVVEVSHTTRHFDTRAKLQAYRQAGVPEYWVVDVQGRQVLSYLAPRYQSRTFAGSAPEGLLNAPSAPPLSPQAYPDVTIDVGALFS